jgi:hypothetical protein
MVNKYTQRRRARIQSEYPGLDIKVAEIMFYSNLHDHNEIAHLSVEEVLRIPNMGPQRFLKLRKWFASRGVFPVSWANAPFVETEKQETRRCKSCGRLL